MKKIIVRAMRSRSVSCSIVGVAAVLVIGLAISFINASTAPVAEEKGVEGGAGKAIKITLPETWEHYLGKGSRGTYRSHGLADVTEDELASLLNKLKEGLSKPLPPRFTCLTQEYNDALFSYLSDQPKTRWDRTFETEQAMDVGHISCDVARLPRFIKILQEQTQCSGWEGGGCIEAACKTTAESVRLRLLVNAIKRMAEGITTPFGLPKTYELKLGTNLDGTRHARPHMMEVGTILGSSNMPKEAVYQYKIHLMPRNEDLEDVVMRLAWHTKTGGVLNNHIAGFKVVCSPPEFAKNPANVMPRIVIYVEGTQHKDPRTAPQAALDALYDIFADMHGKGLDYVPRYNEKISEFLYVAQGHGDEKNIWKKNVLDVSPYKERTLDELRNQKLNIKTPHGVKYLPFPFAGFPYENFSMIYYDGSVAKCLGNAEATCPSNYYHLQSPAREGRQKLSAEAINTYCKTPAIKSPGN